MLSSHHNLKQEAKQAKIVKLNRLDSTNMLQINKQLNNSNESCASNLSVESEEGQQYQDVEGEYLVKLYVIKDYSSPLLYGDLSVKAGEFIHVICETSSDYYLVENCFGIQGFVPKEICIDLEETIKNAKINLNEKECKITSL
jgi:hypothetical protein